MANTVAFEDNGIILLETEYILAAKEHSLIGVAGSAKLATEVLKKHVSGMISIDVILQDACGHDDTTGQFARDVANFMLEHDIVIPVLGLSALPFETFHIDYGHIPFYDVGKNRLEQIGDFVTRAYSRELWNKL